MKLEIISAIILFEIPLTLSKSKIDERGADVALWVEQGASTANIANMLGVRWNTADHFNKKQG